MRLADRFGHAFREDDVKVNELSDAMQLDFLGKLPSC